MNKKAVSQVVFEFISIVFAVLLALGMNSYKQNKDLENEGDLLRYRIISECQRNQVELDSVLIENERNFSYIDSLASLDEITTTSFDISIANELLTKSAWTFTQASRSFSYMDEDFLSDASILYEQQDYYMKISNQMFEKLGDMLMTDPDLEKVVKLTHYYLLNLNNTANELKSTYEEFLENHE